MIIISNEVKKTKEMEQYEKETGKSALWHGNLTQGFKNWKNGEKVVHSDKERISVYLTKENKVKWQNFGKSHDFATISKLIRVGVNFFIKEKSKPFSKVLEDIDADTNFSISHELKERLTTIKGYLQLLLEHYTDELNEDVILTIEKVLEESKQLEKKIINKLDKNIDLSEKYDILLIEDDVSTVNLLVNYFSKKGYSIKGALTGSKGVEELMTTIPKLVLIDIILPDISGFDISKILKSDETFKNVLVYYLTAIPDTEVKKKMEETQADGYILKPFDLSDLEFLLEYL